MLENLKDRRSEKGFTIIEISIVIVLIGLIVSSVFAGQSLIKQAKLRSVVSELNKFQIAIMSFKIRYDSLPGDIINANDYWPNCNSGATASQCNGDGNRRIQHLNLANNNRETFRAWQHLSLADLIYGQYSGIGNRDTLPYEDAIPFSKYKNAVYLLHYFTHFGRNGNYIQIGPNRNLYNGSSNFYYPIFTVDESISIDLKMDDGIANEGNVHGIDGHAVPAGGCSAHYTTVGGADYNLASDTISCRIFYYYTH